MSCSIKAHAILSKIRKDLTHTNLLIDDNAVLFVFIQFIFIMRFGCIFKIFVFSPVLTLHLLFPFPAVLVFIKASFLISYAICSPPWPKSPANSMHCNNNDNDDPTTIGSTNRTNARSLPSPSNADERTQQQHEQAIPNEHNISIVVAMNKNFVSKANSFNGFFLFYWD